MTLQVTPEITLVDLISNWDSQCYDRFLQVLNRIKKSSDRNRANYENLQEDYKKYDSFTVVLDSSQEIMGFSGLNSFSFPSGLARALSRFYLVDSIRFKGLRQHRHQWIGSLYMFPHQLKAAKALRKKAVFVSMEFPRRRRMLQRFMEYNPNGPWQLLDGMAQVCAHEASPTCWQNVIVQKLEEDYEFPLPRISLQQWKERFGPSRPQ